MIKTVKEFFKNLYRTRRAVPPISLAKLLQPVLFAPKMSTNVNTLNSKENYQAGKIIVPAAPLLS